MTLNAKLRVAFVGWLVAFPLISCAPVLLGDGAVGTLIGGFFSLVLGSVLLVPWIVGLLVLGLLVLFTDQRPPDRPA